MLNKIRTAAGAALLAALCFLPVSCIKGQPGDEAAKAIQVAQDANQIVLKTCDALVDEREKNPKFDKFCEEAVRTAEALEALERFSAFLPADPSPADSAAGSGGAAQ